MLRAFDLACACCVLLPVLRDRERQRDRETERGRERERATERQSERDSEGVVVDAGDDIVIVPGCQ